TTALLDKIRHGASDPVGIERLIHIIEDDLGLPLHQAIEANKRALSASPTAPFTFDHAGLSLATDVARADFDAWIGEELDAIDSAVQEVLTTAGIAASAIQRVFATGGSSLVPAVRARLAATFGADRLVGGNELTSVAWGLAAVAAER
ncbi:MAG TPA: Hsp70 family protein, partial [Polyangia bacterium]|nr:Hsp70 family protein [Polyangia bacterium]